MLNKFKKQDFIFILLLGFIWTMLRYHFCDRQMVSVHSLVYHTAATPFQYRYLLPGIIRFLNIQVGLNVLLATFISEFLFFSGLDILMLSLVQEFKPNITDKAKRYFLTGFFLALTLTYIFTSYNNYYFIYDIPSLFFIALGVLLIIKKKFLSLCLIMLFGTLNRETTIILATIFFVVNLNNTASQKYKNTITTTTQTAILLAVWTSIKTLLSFYFADNSGAGSFQLYYGTSSSLTHLQNNLNIILSTKIFSILPFAGGSWLVYFFWKNIRQNILKIFLILFPFYFVAMMVVGIIYELRIFGEFSLFIYLAFFLVILHKFERKQEIV